MRLREAMSALHVTPPADFAIRAESLAKSFGQREVLQSVDIAVRPGEILSIVGRSGGGKSTLLRLIAGLETPSAGKISVQGAVRVVFQEPRLLPWARVWENVAVGLGPKGAPSERRAAALSALAEVGLADHADAWPATLSGGQKQRAALARALVSRPQVLALDEPFGALDALTRLEMQDLLQEVWRAQGFAVALVTHDVAEAAHLADRLIVLDQGRVALDLAIATPRPRRRGDPELAAIEERALARLLVKP